MIVPMKKICLVLQDFYRDEALKKLRDVGVIHLERRTMPVDNTSNAQIRKTKVEEAIGLLSDFKQPKKKKKAPEEDRNGRERRQKPIGLHRGRRATDIFGTEEEAPYSLDAVRAKARPYLPDVMLDIGKERKVLQERNISLSLEITRVAPWGNFNPEDIKGSALSGLPVFLYEITPEIFHALPEDTCYIKVKSDKTSIRLVVFHREIPGVTPFHLPEKSMSGLLEEAENNKVELENLTTRLRNFVDRRTALDKEMKIVEQDLDFEAAVASLEKMEDVPCELNPAHRSLSWVTGYVPLSDLDSVKKYAGENNWALSIKDPDETDELVPTKLKNNKFVSLLNPVTEFLGLLPGYHEVDISPFFLVFFSIFFGMIFGDAAYGTVLFLIAIAFIIKTKVEKKAIPQAFFLLLLLGLSNTAWGALTCTWFGLDIEHVPVFLKNISLAAISEAKTDPAIVTQNLQIFCFSLGLLHLSIAHISNFFRRIRSPRCLGDLGLIAMLAGMYNVVLLLIVSSETRPIPLLPVSLYLLAGGFILNFLFGYYRTSLKQSILASCQNIITVVLGIINVFSDIMSYIRLWAVGLAGAAIAGTANGLAGPMLGSFLVFAGIILFVFGHGMNMVLNVLSVLIHGVRLNTLEFSGHVGLNWSGRAYKPFAKREIN